MNSLHSVSTYSFSDIEKYKEAKEKETLMNASEDMEANFAYYMIKSMRDANSVLFDSSAQSNPYMTMFDIEMSKLFAERGLGLKEIFYKEASRLAGIDSAQEEQDISTEDASMPVKGTVSSSYGLRIHPVSGESRFHHGVDIAAVEGTPITPMRAGKVIFSGEQYGYGNIVEIDHGDGFISKYAHNKVNHVIAGESVEENTVIAEVGASGNSTGPHLHFEVRYNGDSIDPVKIVALKSEKEVI